MSVDHHLCHTSLPTETDRIPVDLLEGDIRTSPSRGKDKRAAPVFGVSIDLGSGDLDSLEQLDIPSKERFVGVDADDIVLWTNKVVAFRFDPRLKGET